MYELLGLGSVDRGGDGDDRVIGRTVNINTRVFTSFFGRTRRLKVDIFSCCMICKKTAHGNEGSGEQQNNHQYATKPLLLKFGSSKHFTTKNSEGESENPKYYNL